LYKSDNSFVFIEELNDKSKKVDLLEYKQIYYKKFGQGLIKEVNGDSMRVLFRTGLKTLSKNI